MLRGPLRVFSAALVASAASAIIALPSFADTPPATSAPGKLDSDRAPTRVVAPSAGLDPDRGPVDAARAPATLPSLPGSAAPSAGAPPPASAPPAEGQSQGVVPPQGYPPPQGYSPPGYSPPGYSPPGYSPPSYSPPGYPPPGYYPPGYYPPGYPPPGYYPPGYRPQPVYIPTEEDYERAEKRARRKRGDGLPPDVHDERVRYRAMAIAGGSALGAGWILAILHGLIGELVGVDCHRDFPCTRTDHYLGIYIPVVGPIVESATHQGTLSDSEKVLLGVETFLQIGGLVTMITGMAMMPPGKPSAPARVSLTLSPRVTPRSASLGLVGTF